MAVRAGIAPSSVHKIWAAHGLKPHLTKTFKLSRDPNFVAKVEDIVGLYLNPPDKALVLAVDEKRSYGETRNRADLTDLPGGNDADCY
jgi:hypothetical protein